MELHRLLLVVVLGLFVCGSRAFFDYIPPIALIKAGIMKLSGENDKKINDVLKKGSYLGHTVYRTAESGVNVISGDMDSARQNMNAISDYVDKKHADELRSIPDGIPVVGHTIAGVHAIAGDSDKAKSALESANSGLGSAVGGAAGLLCGPAAVACVPIGATLGKTAVDGAYTLADGEGKLHGNIDYFKNFGDKGAGEHFDFALGVGLDALGGKVAAKKIATRRMNALDKVNYEKHPPTTGNQRVGEPPNRNGFAEPMDVDADVRTAPLPERMEAAQQGTRTFMRNHPEYKFNRFKELREISERDMNFLDEFDFKEYNDAKTFPDYSTNCFACAVGGIQRKPFSRSGIPATRPDLPRISNKFTYPMDYLKGLVDDPKYLRSSAFPAEIDNLLRRAPNNKLKGVITASTGEVSHTYAFKLGNIDGVLHGLIMDYQNRFKRFYTVSDWLAQPIVNNGHLAIYPFKKF